MSTKTVQTNGSAAVVADIGAPVICGSSVLGGGMLSRSLGAALVVAMLVGTARAELSEEANRRAAGLIEAFSSAEFDVRQKAVADLVAMGPDAMPLVRQALATTTDEEVRLRCQMVLAGLAERRIASGQLVETVVKDLGPLPLREARLVALSSDGRRLAYVLVRGAEQQLVVDGSQGPLYEKVLWLEFSPDGGRLAWALERGAEKFVVVDRRESDAYAELDSMGFSPDGRLWRRVKDVRTGQWAVVCDGKQGPLYNYVEELAFSPKGRMAYVGRRQGDQFVVCDGKELPAYDRIWHLAFSPDGKHLAYAARRAGSCFIVNDGREGRLESRVMWPVYSSSGRLAYVAGYGSETRMVVDGKDGLHFDDVGVPVFSPDGKRLAHWAKLAESWTVVVDGKRSAARAVDPVVGPVFSPDGTRVLFGAQQDGKCFVVLDGRPGPEYDAVRDPAFSAGGRHAAYVAERGGRELVVCDGVEGPPHDRVWLIRGQSGVLERLRAVIADDGKARLVEMPWPVETGK